MRLLIALAAEQHALPIASCSCTRFGYTSWGALLALLIPRPRPPVLPIPSVGRLRDPATSRFYAPQLFPRRQFADRSRPAIPFLICVKLPPLPAWCSESPNRLLDQAPFARASR